MKNLNKELGAKVLVFNGTCSMGGIFITETRITGTIAKINAKSIRVQLEHKNVTRHGKTAEVIRDEAMNRAATFTFWKTVDGRELYKNNEYGILEF